MPRAAPPAQHAGRDRRAGGRRSRPRPRRRAPARTVVEVGSGSLLLMPATGSVGSRRREAGDAPAGQSRAQACRWCTACTCCFRAGTLEPVGRDRRRRADRHPYRRASRASPPGISPAEASRLPWCSGRACRPGRTSRRCGRCGRSRTSPWSAAAGGGGRPGGRSPRPRGSTPRSATPVRVADADIVCCCTTVRRAAV